MPLVPKLTQAGSGFLSRRAFIIFHVSSRIRSTSSSFLGGLACKWGDWHVSQFLSLPFRSLENGTLPSALPSIPDRLHIRNRSVAREFS